MSKPVIHATAVIGPEVEFGEGVVVGPYCILEGKIKLGNNVRLVANVQMLGPVEVGAGTRIFPFACIGFRAQDLKWKDENPTAGVLIGQDCTIREHVTLHAATKADVPTRTGDRCFLMVGSHVGHDARIGNDVVLVNTVLLGGHVDVGDRCILGGDCQVHQFSRIGRLAFIGGGTTVVTDITPFCITARRAQVQGLNIIGLRRNGVPARDITLLRHAFRKVFRVVMPRKEMVATLEELGKECSYVMEMAEFVRGAKRTVATMVPRGAHGNSDDAAPHLI